MRRLARGLLNACTALCALVLVSVCTLWAWSYQADGTLLLSVHKPATILGHNDYSEWNWQLGWSRGAIHEFRMHRIRYWPGNTGVPPTWWPARVPPESWPPFHTWRAAGPFDRRIGED